MALLDDAIEACGGMARWKQLERFTLHLSIDGELLSRAGQAGLFKEMAAEGSTREQSVRFTGFVDPGTDGVFRPDRVAIESLEGGVLRCWPDPCRAFRETQDVPWDELHLIFLCGFSIWNYVMTPFLLAHPNVEVEELAPRYEHDELWRRLRAAFPSAFVTHSPEQIFYFNSEGLQRRTDHDLLGKKVAHYSWAHQSFDGIVLPTLRRSLALEPDGTITTKPALLDVEIFDASFE
jgi:hypothetical protein